MSHPDPNHTRDQARTGSIRTAPRQHGRAPKQHPPRRCRYNPGPTCWAHTQTKPTRARTRINPAK